MLHLIKIGDDIINLVNVTGVKFYPDGSAVITFNGGGEVSMILRSSAETAALRKWLESACIWQYTPEETHG